MCTGTISSFWFLVGVVRDSKYYTVSCIPLSLLFQCQDSHLRERKHTQTPTNPKTPLSFSFSLSQQTNTHKKKKNYPPSILSDSFETDYKQGQWLGFQKELNSKYLKSAIEMRLEIPRCGRDKMTKVSNRFLVCFLYSILFSSAFFFFFSWIMCLNIIMWYYQ